MRRKFLKRMASILLVFAMIVPMLEPTYKVQAAEDNLALNKKVTVSGVEGGYLEDGSLMYPHVDPENLTDGDASTRWSSDEALTSLDLSTNPEQNVWAYVDLEEEVPIGEVRLKWEKANSRDYDIQVSSDGREWTLLKNYQDPDNAGKDYTEVLELERPVKARYVRIYARLGTRIVEAQCQTISLYEIEVYRHPYAEVNLETVLEAAMAADVTTNEDYTKLILPEVPKGFSLRLYASSNLAVADLEGNITRPLEDMNVNLFYEVSMTDGTSLKSDDPKKVTIDGLYDESENINEKPSIVPEIREWKGNEGYLTFNDIIVIESEELRATAEQIAMYLKEMSDIDAEIMTGTPTDGNIYLEIDENSILGDEGYAMEIADIVTVTAKTTEGILYGGTTISQMLSQEADHHSMPKGLIRDYPQYEIRAVMLDVARIYIPLDYLQEMTRYAGYFKISEFRNHINDNGGEQLASFRVESKVYPQLNDGLDPEHVYSQEDYIAYQKDAKKYGVDVVTEIDSPAHAGAFGKIDGSLTIDGNQLDLRTEEAYQKSVSVIKKTFDEFLDGEDPVFQNGKFHIGSDEYNKEYSEVLRRYIDEMIRYVNEKGYETRFWASLGTNGFAGETPVSTDAVAHFWASPSASFDEMKEDGYNFINNNDALLYVVPFANYYHSYLDIKKLYDTWEYSNFQGGFYLAAGHPQLLGAEAALWYDHKMGASEFDIFERFRDQIMLMAEKGWYGDRDDETGEEFIQRVEAVGEKTPKANPARHIESAASLIAAYDFEQVENGVVADAGGNGYDAVLNGLHTENGALLLDGEGCLELPFDSVGYPYTVQFNLTIDKDTPENALLFEGKDGKLFYNYDGTGKLGYERKGYSYLIDMRIPLGINTRFTIVCDATDTRLYINTTEAGSGQYYKVPNVTGSDRQASSTFVLPTEKIGSGIHGTMDNLKLFNYTMSFSEISGAGVTDESDNVALHKAVIVSGVEGGYLEDGSLMYPQFDPMNATDGDPGSRISLNRADDAWVTVDFGNRYLIEKVLIRFNELPNAYALLVSNDGSEWREVDRRTGLEGGSASVNEIGFDTLVSARYIKYQQLEMFPAYGITFSGNFSEMEVYGFDISVADNILENAKTVVENCEVTQENEAFISLLSENIGKLETVLTTGPLREISLLAGTVNQQLEMLAGGDIPQTMADKSELERLLNENLSEYDYKETGWNDYVQALRYAEGIYYDAAADQETVTYACTWVNDTKAQLVYNSAGSLTEEAKAAAGAAEAAAEAAKADAQAAKTGSADAQKAAEAAKAEAAAAQAEAEVAQAKAAEAQAAAAAAEVKAAEARTAAETAAATAGEDSQAAATAQRAAEAAQTAAETAGAGAEEAQAAAEAAQTAAETAGAGAEEAQAAAETAKVRAEEAQTAAETAKTRAEEAQAAAESAKDDAAAARDAAVSARDEAVRAQRAAESAKNGTVEAKDSAHAAQAAAAAARDAAEDATEAAAGQYELVLIQAESVQVYADAAEAAAAAAAQAEAEAEAAKEAAEKVLQQAEEKLEQAEVQLAAAQKLAEEKLAEAEEKLMAANKQLAEAEKLLGEIKVRLERKRFKVREVSLKKVKPLKRKAKVTWETVEGAEGYEICYALKASFKGAKTLNVTGKTSKVIKKLKTRKIYYVKVRGYKIIDGEKAFTQYSAKKKVRVK